LSRNERVSKYALEVKGRGDPSKTLLDVKVYPPKTSLTSSTSRVCFDGQMTDANNHAVIIIVPHSLPTGLLFLIKLKVSKVGETSASSLLSSPKEGKGNRLEKDGTRCGSRKTNPSLKNIYSTVLASHLLLSCDEQRHLGGVALQQAVATLQANSPRQTQRKRALPPSSSST